MSNGELSAAAPKVLQGQELAERLRANREAVEIKGQVIEGDVEVDSLEYSYKLLVRDCVFKGHFKATDMRFGKNVDLGDCTFEQNLDLSGSHVGGRLVLAGATIAGGARAQEAANFRRLSADGDIELDGLRSEVALDLTRARTEGEVSFTSLKGRRAACKGGVRLIDARVAGDADFSGAAIDGDLDLRQAEVGGDVFCAESGGHFTEVGGAVHLYSAKVGSAFFGAATIKGQLDASSAEFRDGFLCTPLEGRPCTFGAGVDLARVSAAGRVHLSGSQIKGPLNLYAAKIAGALACAVKDSLRAEIDGDLTLQRAEVGGDADFDGTLIKKTLNVMEAVIGADLNLRSDGAARFEVGGNAFLAGVSVGGDLSLNGCLIGGNLNIGGGRVEGELSCEETGQFSPEVLGELRAFKLKVGGNIKLTGLQVTKDLNLVSLQAGGVLSFKPGSLLRTTINGKASMLYLTTVGVMLSGADFKSDVSLSSAHVNGSVFCTEEEGHLTEVGGALDLSDAYVAVTLAFHGALLAKGVNANGVKVDGALRCVGSDAKPTEFGDSVMFERATFLGRAAFQGLKIKGGLRLQSASVGGELIFSTEKQSHFDIEGAIDLTDVRARKVTLDFEPLPPAARPTPLRMNRIQAEALEVRGSIPPELDLSDLQCRSLSVPADDYLGLLKATKPFKKSTYLFLEKWLKEQGQDKEAKDVYVAMRRRAREGKGRFSRLGDWLLDVTVGYGVHSFRLLVYLLAVMCLSVFLLSQPGALEPDKKPQPAAAAAPVADDRPAESQPFWSAMQVNIPVVTISAADGWKPSPSPVIVGGTTFLFSYRTFASTVSLLNLILLPLFLASISGIIKRQ